MYHGTARRTAEIKKNIDRRVLRGQLAEIKALAKQQQKELDALQARQAEQRARLAKAVAERVAAEARRQAKEEDALARRAAAERDAEARRCRAETEALAKAQAAAARDAARAVAAQVKQLQRVHEEWQSERARRTRNDERAYARTVRGEARAVRGLLLRERRAGAAHEEARRALALAQQCAALQRHEDAARAVRDAAAQQALVLAQRAQHFALEHALLDEAHAARRAELRAELQVREREQQPREHALARDALRQVHALRAEQLERRFALEQAQQHRQQAVEARVRAKELRQCQKRRLDVFAGLQRDVLRTAADRRHATHEQHRQREEFVRGLHEEEARAQQAALTRMEDEDRALADAHAAQRRALHARHDAQLAQLDAAQAAARDALAREGTRRTEELAYRQCQETANALARDAEQMAALWLRAVVAVKDVRTQCQQAEIAALCRDYDEWNAACTAHNAETLALVHERHALQRRECECECGSDDEERRRALEEAQQRDLAAVEAQYDAACSQAAARHRVRVDKASHAHDDELTGDAAWAAARLADLRTLLLARHAHAQHDIDETLAAHTTPAALELPVPHIPPSPYPSSCTASNAAAPPPPPPPPPPAS